ncbi:MAG: bacterial Ig-like domain-containing protein [Bacilli bacterium]|nr:bacterial Ig-like domain-containing protein [Bacilli bacterium]
MRKEKVYMKKKYLLLLPFLTFAMSAAACNNANVDPTPSTVAVTGVKLDQSSITLDVGDTKQLKATVEPENATDKTVSWTVGDSSIASVRDGLVSALAKGSTVVTVIASTFTAQCNVTVNEKAVAPTLSSITVTGYKERYELNEALSIVVKAQYSDRTEKTLAASEYQVTGFDSSTAGSKTVVVSYQGKQQIFTVEVVRPAEKVIASIAIAQEPTKKEYQLNQTLDLRGLKVVATYTDGTSAEIFNYGNSPLDSSTPGEKTITISAGEKTATFKVTVIAPAVQNISITHEVNKKKYTVGDIFDKTGLEVTAYYSNGTSAVVTNYQISNPDMSSAGTKEITVTYEQKTVKFSIVVETAPVLQDIELNTTNVKKTFFVGETFVSTGLVVTAKYDKGGNKNVPLAQCSISNPDMSSAGEKIITVSFENKSKTYTINVNNPVIESITIDTTNVDKKFFVGEVFNSNGLIVKAKYNDNSERTLTDDEYNVSEPDMSSAGTKIITVSFDGQSKTYQISVTAVSVSSIAVTHAPNKTTYEIGEELVIDGLVVTATNTDSSTQAVTGYELSGFDSSTAGTKTVTVTYQTKTATFDVTVLATPVLQSIELNTENVKKEFANGETFTYEGLVVTAKYDRGSDKNVPLNECQITGAEDMSSAGEKTIIVTYQNKTDNYKITVGEPAPVLQSISITHEVNKKSYYIGDEFDKDGLEITAHYSDESSQVVENYELSGFDSSSDGEKTITVSFGGKTTTFKVEVNVSYEGQYIARVYHNSEWQNINLTGKNENTEYYVEGLELAAGDELVFCMGANNAWRKYGDIKPTSPAKANFIESEEHAENIYVEIAGTYNFYIVVTAPEDGLDEGKFIYIAKTPTLTLDKTSVEFNIGENPVVNVTKHEGTVTVESSDELVATAEIAGNVITLNSVKNGNAVITVRDDNGSAEINLTVVDPYAGKYVAHIGHSGEWRDVDLTGKNENTEYFVKTLRLEENDEIVFCLGGIEHWHKYGDIKPSSPEKANFEESETNAGNISAKTAGYYDFYIVVTAPTEGDDNGKFIYIAESTMMSLSSDTASMSVDGNKQITVENPNGDVTATSNDETVATATYNEGILTITGKKVGSTTVSVTDGIVTRTVSVTVTEITTKVTITLQTQFDAGMGSRAYLVGDFSNWEINANAIAFEWDNNYNGWKATFEVEKDTVWTCKVAKGAYSDPVANPTGWEDHDNRTLTFDESKTITL